MARHLELGAAGEDAAAEWYRRRGAVILDRNWRGEAGEIDLICETGSPRSTLVVCEVKTRTGTRFGTGAEAVDFRKQRRLRRAAAEWLAARSQWWPDIRFDVASVDWDGRGLRIDVIEGAF